MANTGPLTAAAAYSNKQPKVTTQTTSGGSAPWETVGTAAQWIPGQTSTSGGIWNGTDFGFTGYRPVTGVDYNGNRYPGYQKGDTNFVAFDPSNPNVGYLEHRSGYTGNATYDPERNRYYTDYGALVREDDHIYTPGSILSPNGMYEDLGNGFVSANHGTMMGPNLTMAVRGDTDGYRPGQSLDLGLNFGGYSGGASGGTSGTSTGTTAETPSLEDVIAAFDPENSRDSSYQAYYDDLLNLLLNDTTRDLQRDRYNEEQTGSRGW